MEYKHSSKSSSMCPLFWIQCVQEASRQCALLHNAMTVVYDLVKLIKFSPKQLYNLRKEISIQSRGENFTTITKNAVTQDGQ